MTALAWTRPRSLTLRRIPISKIDIPEEYERKELAEDDAVGRSIKQHGVQQPGVAIPKGDRFLLVDGVRRVRLSEKNGATDIPLVLTDVPPGVDETAYRNRLRFILNNARQDLPPSQKAAVIRQMMALTNLTQKDVAALLGFDAGSVSGWLVVEAYAPLIRQALDAEAINSHQARSLENLTHEGQIKVFRNLRKEFARLSGDDLQRLVSSKFSPKLHPSLYVDAGKAAEKLARKKKGRTKKRAPLSRDEKRILSNSLELAEIELADLKLDNQRMKRECVLAAPVLNAIKRNKRLWAMVSKDMQFEVDTFLERY